MPLPWQLQKAVSSLLGPEGKTGASLRQSVFEHTRTGQDEVPGPLRAFVDKIAAVPWTITEDDFAQLRAAGYSEDQIYELVLASALGAGLRRFDAGLRAVEGEN